MTYAVRKAFAAALALAALAAVGALSQLPYTAERATHAVIRLAWRARGERVEECRRLTPEELARIPAHMRREEECVGRLLPYRLQVTLDGSRAVDQLVQAAGARHDRPLFVFRELPVSPGQHALAVTFTHEGTLPAGARAEEEAERPLRLVLDTIVTLTARRALLVTYDEARRELVVKDATD